MNNIIGNRPTWAEVNLKNLAFNFQQIKKIIPKDVSVMACVKADAYGHGLIPVARRLALEGVNYLSVASIDEGLMLRDAGIKVPILVLGAILEKNIAPLLEYSLTQTVCTESLAYALNKYAKKEGKFINIHIKIDTGMGRLGVLHKDALSFISKIKKLSNLKIEGIFTHLTMADVNRDFTLHQIDVFSKLITELNKKGIKFPYVHSANSLGVASYKESHFNMVRPGLIIYGLYPDSLINIKLKPVLALKTKVVYAKRVPSGYGISYGYTYVTKKDTTIANLPIGYGDGYPRNLSNLAPVLIKGKRFKISGRVCMDQMMIDVGNYKIGLGEEVVLIGNQGKEKITAEELAALSATIPYEIVCGLGSRIPRIYI